MPSISKIRFTHVIYENGNKRYNNEIFEFHGHNGAIVLENGGGKTVFIQTAVQAVIPHSDLAGRKVKETFQLENGPAHIAIEWILNDMPRRRYAVTCVTLFQSGNGVDSFRYVYEYGENDSNSLDQLPFVKEYMGKIRPADKGEMLDYYSSMEQRYPLNAKSFPTIKEFKSYLEDQYQIINGEWEAIVKINDTEGGIENFFDECKTTTQLFDRLLIPTVEQSIEGFEQGSFARMFEAHREGFKKYKELKEQIEENKLILQELGRYVNLFEGLDQMERNYENSRSDAKAYWQMSKEHASNLEAEKMELLRMEEDWRKRSDVHGRKRKALEIARAQQELGALETKLQMIQVDLQQAENMQRDAEIQYYSLQYAEIREKWLLVKANLKQLVEKIGRLDHTEDEQELQRRWELNGGQLRYLFEDKEWKLTAFRTDKENVATQLAELIRSIEANRQRLNREKTEMGKEALLKEAEQQSKREQMAQIARSILSNPQLEKVEHQVPLWAEEEQRLEQRRLDILQELKRLEEFRVLAEHRRKEVSEERAKSERELARLQEQEKLWQSEHEELKKLFVRLRPSWEKVSSLYEKQASIQEQIADAFEKLRQQKQKYLMKERIAYRYVDDHGEQNVFFADAAVAKLCEQWSHQFTLLQLGTDYLRSMGSGLENEEHAAQDQLWAVTLITTEKEKPALKQKLEQVNGTHAFPIRVLSVQEAADTLQGQETVDRAHSLWVVPEHWRANGEPARFEQWKAELAEQADLVKNEREKTEAEMTEWQTAQRMFAVFMDKYPLQVQQELEKKRLSEQARLSGLNRELDKLEYELTTNRQTEERSRKMVEEIGSRIMQLGMWLQNGHQYIRLNSEVIRLEEELVPIRKQLEIVDRQLAREQSLLEQKQSENDRILADVRDSEMQLQLLYRDEWYSDVQAYAVVPTQGSIEEWKAERKALELERHRIIQERTQLESEFSRERDRETDYIQSMEALKREHPELDADMSLPLESAMRKQEWWASLEDFRGQVKKLKQEEATANGNVQVKQGAIETLLRQFASQYSQHEPERFIEPLGKVEERLCEEEAALHDEEKQLKRQQLQTGKLQQEIEQVLDIWNKHLLMHALEDVKLTASVISAENRMEFDYHRMQFAEACIQQLTDRHSKLKTERDLVQKRRQLFKDFCSSRVNDIKLRQVTIQGIETKVQYEEIKEFQKSMDQRIQMVIHIGEQTLQTHDQELQQYIQHIHAHLKLVIQELKEIPKKTRVKSEEGWKEIYSFSIPEWEEQDGKDRVRGHIDWIMNKLDRYDEQGDWQEQQGAIRKDLDKWLDSKALLQIVMRGEGMKVSCRKVMNDQQVTRAAYSWEQSNRWSGGEKWSKNMTLFLGLLNYVAERKQFIPTKMKRHRVVILDNPFGKASSDHVLSPVFFIAEQLGFQLIALTAHMEGKFLQDYFPIVYSCRLRHTADSSKQIVEATQQIQTAYFRDNDPETLERIGRKVGQMELF